MQLTPFCILTLLTLFRWGDSLVAGIPDRACVSSFEMLPDEVEIFNNELCLIMINEKPYVFPDPTFSAAPADSFLCRDHDIVYAELQGLFFDILRRVSKRVPEVRKARCIHAGSKCIFDNSVRFWDDVAKNDSRYRFVAATRCNRSHGCPLRWLYCPGPKTHGTPSRRPRNKCFNLRD